MLVVFTAGHSRSHDAVIRAYDEAGNVIETHEHKGDFKEWCLDEKIFASKCESSFFPGTPRKSLPCNNVTGKWFIWAKAAKAPSQKPTDKVEHK
jgi:hypothetical protein